MINQYFVGSKHSLIQNNYYNRFNIEQINTILKEVNNTHYKYLNLFVELNTNFIFNLPDNIKKLHFTSYSKVDVTIKSKNLIVLGYGSEFFYPTVSFVLKNLNKLKYIILNMCCIKYLKLKNLKLLRNNGNIKIYRIKYNKNTIYSGHKFDTIYLPYKITITYKTTIYYLNLLVLYNY